MIEIRKGFERGLTKTDWLESYHSFSFNSYYDPKNTRFGSLRVLNDDIVKPGQGFGLHPHDNMEIVTYVLEGAIEHQDTTGAKAIIQADEVQRMTAGSGIYHSEYNHSKERPLRLLQVWFYPNEKNLTPSYEQRLFKKVERRNKLLLVASGEKTDTALFINQDAKMYVSNLENGNTLSFKIESDRGIYLYLADGEIGVNGIALSKGDAIKVWDENEILIKSVDNSEFVLFDVKIN
ncbi:MAG: pirin family protein [Ignavibacteria bacterium]|nr:pirin family protein [Ignavibacteria bacterium]